MKQIATTLVCISFLFIGTGLVCFGKRMWWVHIVIAGICAVIRLVLSLMSASRRKKLYRRRSHL